jgi:hypothetical protein
MFKKRPTEIEISLYDIHARALDAALTINPESPEAVDVLRDAIAIESFLLGGTTMHPPVSK